MWWSTAHQKLVDQLTPDQKRSIKKDESILICVRTLQNYLKIYDAKLALHLVRGIKADAQVSELQHVFEELMAREDRREFCITSV